ncbi:MAG: uracil-DNA glycosylase family protein [Muribaculaceae bacterium]|nr:uracil-DNA glycosylase family protein [Muribaculaceae bacterium]
MTDYEQHPWEPYIPQNARILIMGTFPPGPHRWSMDFYYPNRTNDFWYMMGLIFFGNREALLTPGTKNFDLAKIKALLNDKGIAMNDTVKVARRLKNNASDKFLEVIEPVDLHALLKRMPLCHTVITTGDKATVIAAEQLGVQPPAMGHSVTSVGDITLWRCPSTSRAYPLPLAKKAEFYSVAMTGTVLNSQQSSRD